VVALVSWLGFEDYDNTWEPLSSLKEDVPSLVAHFLALMSALRSPPVRVSRSVPELPLLFLLAQKIRL
jgi:hypothetical protein